MFKSSLLIVAVLGAMSAAADTITGTVSNHTTGQPAVGDPVVLLRLGEGMQEEARTKTDAQGEFVLNLSDANASYVIRVLHQGVNYDQPINASGAVALTVYDVVSKVPGLNGPMGFAQIQSDGKVYKITEMYDIRNNSNPPVTQLGPDNFPVIVPPNAVFDSVEARRAQGIWLNVKPEPMKGSGKFNLNFPIRPGDTLFKFSYHVPNNGPLNLHLRVPYPIEKFGVMHPSSMLFKASRPNDFKSGQISPGLQGELTIPQPIVGDVPAFQISGTGEASAHGTESSTLQSEPAASAPPTVSAAPHTGQNAETAAAANAERSHAELWLMIAGIVIILTLAGFVIWRVKRSARGAPAQNQSELDFLKEKLFQLEGDRLRGAVSAEDYAASRKALNQSIERLTASQ